MILQLAVYTKNNGEGTEVHMESEKKPLFIHYFMAVDSKI